MVNAHAKYPNDVKHNTIYPADGTDLRDATAEEVEKYRLAATHKRRKPEVEAPGGKIDTIACATRGDKKDEIKPSKRDESKHREESGRQGDKILKTRNKSTEGNSGRTASHESRKGDEGNQSRSRNEGVRRESERRHGDRLSDREEKGRGVAVELDEDERDRREMAEIRRRMDERKTAKALEKKKTVKTVPSLTVSAASDMTPISKKGARGNPDVAKKGGEEKNSGSRKGVKKSVASYSAASAADAAQRDDAKNWASSAASEASASKSSVSEKLTAKSRATRNEQRMDTADEIAVQDFVAAQYPPIEETVSVTVRMGRALVSGALGMRTDDPKLFATAVRLPECTVVLQSTNAKAKLPVSAAPPNSTSEVDVSESDYVQLSQAATDIGVHIELPDGDIESTQPGMEVVRDNVAQVINLAEAPETPGVVGTPIVLHDDTHMGARSKESIDPSDRVMTKSDPCNVIAATICSRDFLEAQQMVREIDNAKLLQQELIRRDPSFASGSPFLDTVCGRVMNDRVIKETGRAVGEVGDGVVATSTGPTQTQMGARVIEKQRMMRILVAKSMLEEELAKDEPSAASVAVLKLAVYGRDEPKDAAMLDAEITVATTTGAISISDTLMPIRSALEPEGTCEIRPKGDGNEGLTSDDIAMSIGDSEEDEDGSDGFSRSGSSSSRGESTLSRGSRKRPADESPESEPTENSRRDFPGIVTRSEGGFRIYVPRGIGVESSIELGAIVSVTTTDGTVVLKMAEEIVASAMKMRSSRSGR